MKLRFTARATQDLIEISEYIRERNANASQRVRAALLESLQTLIIFPEAGRRQGLPSVRKLVTRKYSYLIYYSFDQAKDEIVILTIQHSAREREYEDV